MATVIVETPISIRGRDQYSAFSSSISRVSSFVSVSCVYALVFVCLFFCLTVLETTLSSTFVVSVSVRDFSGWLNTMSWKVFENNNNAIIFNSSCPDSWASIDLS